MSETLKDLDAPPSLHPLAPLHDPGTIRARCAAILRSVEAGVSSNFALDRSRLDAVAERVAALTLRRFPDLVIPYHSRWRHFESGGVDRKAEMDLALAGRSPAEQARARFDLTVVSVLLDAGAGPNWRYTESRKLAAAALPQAAPDELLAKWKHGAKPGTYCLHAEGRAPTPQDAQQAQKIVSKVARALAGCALAARVLIAMNGMRHA